jgi:hypothetical protein
MSYQNDVVSVDAIIRALYGTILRPAGPTDLGRDRHFLRSTARTTRGLPAQEGALYLKNAPIFP